MTTPKQQLIESLRLLCGREGGRAAVAAAIGSSEKSLWHIINGTKLPSGETRGIGARLQKRLDERYPGWHLLGNAVASEDAALDGSPPVYIPMLENSASMGGGAELMSGDVIAGRLPLAQDWVNAHTSRAALPHLRFIHGVGDSMSPTFEDGDILLVDATQRDPASIDGIYALRVDGRLFIKRVRQNVARLLEISSDNPAVKTVDVLDGGQEVEVLGRVIWVWNGRKV